VQNYVIPSGFRIMVTGHRPKDLFGYDLSSSQYNGIRRVMADIIQKAQDKYHDVSYISGMALGADMLWAEEVYKRSLPLYAFIPFRYQAKVWNQKDQQHWQELIEYAVSVHITDDSSNPNIVRALHKRNEDMIVNSDLCLAICHEETVKRRISSGERLGGTYGCMLSALKHGLKVFSYDPFVGSIKIFEKPFEA